MSDKLKAMSPQERTDYIQQHPDEMKNAYSQIPGTTTEPPKPAGN